MTPGTLVLDVDLGPISLDRLFEHFLEDATARRGSPPSLRAWVDLAEAWRITHALHACRGNRSAAARELGIGRRTLYSKMEKLGIEPRFSCGPVTGPVPGPSTAGRST